MTIAKLYEKHKKGEVSKQSFLYEARKDANLPWINNLTSFEDAVKILKNKSVITEGASSAMTQHGQAPPHFGGAAYNLPIEEDQVNEGDFDALVLAFEDLVKQFGENSNGNWRLSGVTDKDENEIYIEFESKNMYNAVKNLLKKSFPSYTLDAPENGQATISKTGMSENNIEEDQVNEGQFSWITQDTGTQIGSEYRNRIEVTMYDNKGNSWPETHYEGYGVFGGKDYYELLAQMNGMPDGDRSDGIDIAFGDVKTEGPVLYPALIQIPGRFNYKQHDFTQAPPDDPNQSWYQDTEDDYDNYEDEEEDEYNEYDVDDRYNESLNEAHDLTTSQIIDRLNPYEFKKAVEYEMAKLKVFDNISYEKVKEKVAKKMAKDPLAYRYTQLANSKKIEKQDKALEMKPVKSDNLVDTANELKKIKGFKEEKANTKSTKKENRKGMPKGVKEMKGSLKKPTGVKQVMKHETKETVINEMLEFFKKKSNLKEDSAGGATPQERDDLFPNTDCMTPDGKGVVVEKRGSIVTVKLEDGSERDYTLNVLDAAKEKETQSQIDADKAERDQMWSDWDKKGEKTFGGTAMYPMSSTKDLLKKLKGLLEKYKIKKEAVDVIKAKTPQGGEEVIDTVPAGQGNKAIQDLKKKISQKGGSVTSLKTTTVK